MSPKAPSCPVSLPSIHEMFPDHLFIQSERAQSDADTGLSARPRTLTRSLSHDTVPEFILPLSPHGRNTVHPAHNSPVPPRSTLPSASAPRCPVPNSPMSLGSFPPSPEHPSLEHRGVLREDDKRHVCDACGKAFNRPSSLAIHINTHTGAKPFICPFPGCARKFNVNSNMRRHLRNHTSGSSRSSTLTPYTYPLTTYPRNMTFATSSSLPHQSPSSSASSSPRLVRQNRLPDSDEEDSSLSGPELSSQWDSEMEDANAGINRLRLRSRSSPGARAPPGLMTRHEEGLQTSAGIRRIRSHSCAVPGCDCRVPAALHPSGSARYRL